MYQLNVCTLNVRGLVDSSVRKTLFSILEEHSFDIICLQEVHCTDNNVDKILRDWKGQSVVGLSDSPFSRGVCILFNDKVELKIIDTHKTNDGRIVLVNVEIKDVPFTIINIYAPNNEKLRCSFFKKVNLWINRYCLNHENLFLAGDMNCCIRDIDRSSKTHMNDKSRIELNKLTKCCKLIDSWDRLYPNVNGYTWRNHDESVCSRLDYIFVSKSNIDNIKEVHLMYIPNSDHKLVKILVNVSTKNNGPGYWKLNSNLLDNHSYIDGVKTIIKRIEESTKHLSSKRVSWEILKVRLKEFSIQFSVKLAKDKQRLLNKYQDELSLIDKISEEHITDDIKKRKTILKQKYETYVKEREKGAFIRSRAFWAENGERSTKFFFSLEKKRQSANVIKEIMNDEQTMQYEDEEILNCICEFYEKLYKTQNPKSDSIKSYLETVTLPRILEDKKRKICDAPLHINEFDDVIKKLKTDKSPGDDGLTANFYKLFWGDLKFLFFEMILECYEYGELSSSMKRAIVALLFKKGDTWMLKNYRPISLSNYDYKILAFVLAERLQTVIGCIIGNDQSAYIRNRFIGNSARVILDVIDYCDKFNEEAVLLCLDFEKAFDSLEWDFLHKVLEKFNFGPYFCKWMKILYTNPALMFKNNGWISKKIFPTRGIRQGCPISALLFIIVVEVLAIKIRSSNDIYGFKLGTAEIKVKQYADDTTLILKRVNDIYKAVDIIDEFGNVAGLKLNKNKTEAILLGSLKNRYKSINNITFTNKAVRCLGIYIGHDTDECYSKNWTEKLTFFEQTLERWKKRNLTIFGRILIIKTLALSKFVYNFGIMTVSKEVISEITKSVFNFIWKGKDRIKRETAIGPLDRGGLNMIDVECFIMSLHAAWATRILCEEGGCDNIFIEHYAKLLGLSCEQLFMSNIRSDATMNPCMRSVPDFYRSVIYSFNNSKFLKNVNKMNSSDFFSQIIWNNEFFCWRNRALNFKNWCDVGIIYICDLFDKDGNFKQCHDILAKLQSRSNWIAEYAIVKKSVCEICKRNNIDQGVATAINKSMIRPNKFPTVKGIVKLCKNNRSKFYYNLLVLKKFVKPIAHLVWNRHFVSRPTYSQFEKSFERKVLNINDIKLKEFNFKLLHRILPCGLYLSKWKQNISDKCLVCKQVENIEHMLFSCGRIQVVWTSISKAIQANINFKHIVFGFSNYKLADLDFCISVCAYLIFKTWLLYSFDDDREKYKLCDVSRKLKMNYTEKCRFLSKEICSAYQIY